MPSRAAFFSRTSSGSRPSSLGQLVDGTFHREGRHRRAGGAIGRLLGPVGHHVPAHGLHVLQIIGREGRHRAHVHRRAGIGAALIAQLGETGGDAAVLRHAEPHIGGARRRRPGGAQHLRPAHHHLDRAGRSCRQHQRHRLEEHGRLAAEAAADLAGGHPQLALLEPEDRGAGVAHEVLALRAAPQVGLPVGAICARQACGSI